MLAGCLGNASQWSAFTGHLVEELVERAIGARSEIEPGLIPGLAHAEHLPVALGERMRLAAIVADRVKLRVAGLLADEEDLAIVPHPAERIGSALWPANPCIVVDVYQHARLAGSGVEREEPAV